MDQPVGRGRVDRHNRGVTEQAAELDGIADLLARDRDYPDGGGLVVDHPNGGLVGDHCTDSLRWGITGDGDHVETDRANRGHRLKLGDVEGAGLDGLDHPRILRNRDEGTGQPANVAASHDTALFDGVVKHC